MSSNPLMAISPIDGRYFAQVKELSAYFSEFAFIKVRVEVEIEYLIALLSTEINVKYSFTETKLTNLRKIYQDFSVEDGLTVKNIEKTINHDVKAVEYFIKNKISELGFENLVEFIHFGLTSQDINNTTQPLIIKRFWENCFLPQLNALVQSIETLANSNLATAMLARTHGQPASPTRLGKELLVFTNRINDQLKMMLHIPFRAKFGGATGNLNAHYAVFPNIDWHGFSTQFIESLGLERTNLTTQIEPYDHFAAFCDAISRINTILIDFSRDIWQYISVEYFKQKVNKNEVGSSAMPHKVNPIDFENAEGNLGYANAILQFFSQKLPISRLQRDLSDSTVLRNVGVPFAHSFLAYKNLQRGIAKLEVNHLKIEADLEKNCVVILEAIQNVLRISGFPKPYELIKNEFRGEEVTMAQIQAFINKLDIGPEIKVKLLAINPHNFVGEIPNR